MDRFGKRLLPYLNTYPETSYGLAFAQFPPARADVQWHLPPIPSQGVQQ